MKTSSMYQSSGLSSLKILRFVRIIAVTFLFTLIGAFCPTSALAYIDPGTGSLLLQGILAGSGGLLLFFKLFWKRIRSFFSKQRNSR